MSMSKETRDLTGKQILMLDALNEINLPDFQKWYSEHIEGSYQRDTITLLLEGLDKKEINVRQALCLCLVCGFQLNTKYEGIP